MTRTIRGNVKARIAAGAVGVAGVLYAAMAAPVLAQTCVAPPANLVSWWPGDGDALDIRGANEGLLVNGTAFVPGKVGQTFSFDGQDDYIEIPNAPNLNPTNALSVEAWYKTVSFAGDGNNPIVDKGYSSHVYPFYQYHLGVTGDLYTNNQNAFNFSVTAGGIVRTVFIDHFWEPDRWYHLVGTYDGSWLRLYVDGTLVDSAALSGTMVDYGRPVLIGAFSNLPVNNVHVLPGAVDEVAIYDRALSLAEIQDIFNTGSAGKCKNIDTDGDGLLDTTELDMAMGSDCPDPLDPDSDGDTLLDGEEVALGTNPCEQDTDGDGVDDALDPWPTQPGVTSGFLEDATRDLADDIGILDPGLFNAPNNNANRGRRNSLANRATEAANAIAAGDIQGAIDKLVSLLQKVDGQSPPPDWMDESPEKELLRAEASLLIALLELL